MLAVAAVKSSPRLLAAPQGACYKGRVLRFRPTQNTGCFSIRPDPASSPRRAPCFSTVPNRDVFISPSFEEVSKRRRWSITVLRWLRLAKGESLLEVGAHLNFRQSVLSQAERFPNEAGMRLRRALEAHYDAPWQLLSQRIDAGEAIASAIVHALQRK